MYSLDVTHFQLKINNYRAHKCFYKVLNSMVETACSYMSICLHSVYSAPSNRIWNNTSLRSPKQQIWLRTALCGGWCRRMALRNRELHARNDDEYTGLWRTDGQTDGRTPDSQPASPVSVRPSDRQSHAATRSAQLCYRTHKGTRYPTRSLFHYTVKGQNMPTFFSTSICQLNASKMLSLAYLLKDRNCNLVHHAR